MTVKPTVNVLCASKVLHKYPIHAMCGTTQIRILFHSLTSLCSAQHEGQNYLEVAFTTVFVGV